MSKSIIVINTPTSCVECPLSYYNECFSEHYCRHSGYLKTIADYDYQRKAPFGEDVKPEWCPLTPLPELKDHTYTGTGKTCLDLIIECAHDEGYNECLQDLNGGNL